MESRAGITHEHMMRGAHVDNDPNRKFENDGNIYSAMRPYCTQQELDNADYTLITKFSGIAYLAKGRDPEMIKLDMLKDYYPLLFLKISKYAETKGVRVIEVMEMIVEQRVSIEKEIFPIT